MMSSPPETPRPRPFAKILVAGLLLVLLGAGGYLLFTQLAALRRQMARLDSQVTQAVNKVEQAAELSQDALQRAVQAEQNADRAAHGRVQAEEARTQAETDATQARQQAASASEQARLAREEAELIRKQREEELDRLQKALSQLAETRRTAMGLVMNLGSDAIQFDFDKANLRPQNRELLSRIAGVLMTSTGYRVHVYGHTDDVGSVEYNQDLSRRRAQSVRDYLVEAGIDPKIMTTRGYGKSSPRVQGTSEAARATNRRVEIGIIDSTIAFEGAPDPLTRQE